MARKKALIVYCPACGEVRGRGWINDYFNETVRLPGNAVLVYSHERQAGATWEMTDHCPGGMADETKDKAP